jgi:hypothetical protein
LLTCLQWCRLPLTTWNVSAACIQVYVPVEFLFLHCITWWIDITTKTSICPSRRQLTRTTPSYLTNRNILFPLLYSTSLDADSVRRDLILIGWTNRRQRFCCLPSQLWVTFPSPICTPPISMMIYFNLITTVNIIIFIDDHCLWQGIYLTIPILLCTRSVITCQWDKC